MLERWMPYAGAAFNPVFRFGVRRLRFGRSARALRRRSLILIAVSSAIILCLWAASLIGTYNLRSCATTEPAYCYYPLIDSSASFIAGLALFSVAIDVFLDLTCILAGYQTLRLETEAVHWDLLRLTPMRIETLIDAHYAVAQARAWLMTALVTTLRVATVALFLLTIFVLPLVLRGFIGDLGLGYDFSWLFSFTGLALVAAIFMIEPLWRMRAVTALGLALASRFRQPTFGALAGLGSIFALWLAEAILLGMMFWLTALVGRLSWSVTPAFGAILGAFVIGLFYRALTSRSLARAVREAAPR